MNEHDHSSLCCTTSVHIEVRVCEITGEFRYRGHWRHEGMLWEDEGRDLTTVWCTRWEDVERHAAMQLRQAQRRRENYREVERRVSATRSLPPGTKFG